MPAIETILAESVRNGTVGVFDGTKQAVHGALRLPDYMPVFDGDI